MANRSVASCHSVGRLLPFICQGVDCQAAGKREPLILVRSRSDHGSERFGSARNTPSDWLDAGGCWCGGDCPFVMGCMFRRCTSRSPDHGACDSGLQCGRILDHRANGDTVQPARSRIGRSSLNLFPGPAFRFLSSPGLADLVSPLPHILAAHLPLGRPIHGQLSPRPPRLCERHPR